MNAHQTALVIEVRDVVISQIFMNNNSIVNLSLQNNFVYFSSTQTKKGKRGMYLWGGWGGKEVTLTRINSTRNSIIYKLYQQNVLARL